MLVLKRMWYYDGYQLDAKRNTKVDTTIQKTQISFIIQHKDKKTFMHNLSNHNQLKILIF
jgi:hypothetical protein